MWKKIFTVAIAAVFFWTWLSVPLENEEYQLAFLDTPAVIRRHGYPVETHRVRTADGYLLALHRIPGRGPPVLVQHGYLQSSASFVLGGPGHSLGYQLADSGFDVWLGNSRGNYYSRGHVNSSITRSQYWDFSWHEMGVYDLPATIDTILNVTARQQLHYVGFSMGTTALFVMATSRPEYNSRVASMVSLASAAYLKHLSSTLAYYTFVGSHSLEWLLDALGIYQLFPRTRVLPRLTIGLCGMGRATSIVCTGLYSLIGGHNPTNLDTDVLAIAYGHDPSGSSLKAAAHFGQSVLTGKFRQFDYGSDNVLEYGQPEPPEYNLSKFTVPITMFYGGADTIASPRDAKRLYSMLTHAWPKSLHWLREYSHMDFSCGSDANKRVYQRIVSSLGSS